MNFVPQETSRLLVVDYRVRPSFGLRMHVHPERTDVREIDPARIKRVQVLGPDERRISGHEWLRRLADRGPLDMRVLEEFWRHKELIPAAWRQGHTCFFETRFLDPEDMECVAHLSYCPGGWELGHRPLDWDFGPSYFAACLSDSP